jgi:flagellar motor component MotA
MKSAYELAMERLEKSAPTRSLSAEQKAELADLDNRYRAKVAERRIFLEDQLRQATDPVSREEIRRQLVAEVSRLEEELEEKKNRIREGRDA